MCAIIRYNQKRIIWYIENFIFHNLQIGVNWCVEWGTHWNVHTRKHSPCKEFNSKIYHEFADNKQMFVNMCVWKYYTDMERFVKHEKFW